MKTIFTLIIFCCLCSCLNAQFLKYSMFDYSFGYKGRVTTTDNLSYYNFGSETRSVLVQKDGKIIIAGNSSGRNGYDFLFIRYFPNGEIDSSFGENGFVHYGHKDNPNILDALTQAKLQPDGKIVVSAYSFQGQCLLRFLPTGKVDSSFGEHGRAELFKKPFSIDIDTEGNIIACESYNDVIHLVFALQRFDKNGKPDLSFGRNNLVRVIIGEQSILGYGSAKVKVNKAGKIIVSGTWYPNNNDDKSKLVILRFHNNGSIDNSFNDSGKVVIDNNGQSIVFGDMGFQSNNKIIIGGTFKHDRYSQEDYIVTRINKNGSIDSTFGINGFVTTDLSTTLPLKGDAITNICIQNDDKIIAAGSSARSADLSSGNSFSLCRYNFNGSLDTSFGEGGLEKTSFGDNLDCEVDDATLQPDGKIILAEIHNLPLMSSGDGEIAIARYNKEHMYLETSDFSDNKIKEHLISLYPNPAKNILHVDGLDANNNYTIKIINETGNLVSSTKINKSSSYNLNAENLSSGVYYLSITSNQNTITRKFIKE